MLNWQPGRTQLPAGPASERGVVGLGPGPRRRRGRRKTVRGLSGTLAEPVRLGSKSDRNRYRDCYDRSSPMLLTRSVDSILNGGCGDGVLRVSGNLTGTTVMCQPDL